MFNKSKPGSLGNIKIIWTKKALQKEANKYNTRFEFAKNNSSAYSVSCSKKIIDDLFTIVEQIHNDIDTAQVRLLAECKRNVENHILI